MKKNIHRAVNAGAFPMVKLAAIASIIVFSAGVPMCAGDNRQGAHPVKRMFGAMNGEPVVPREANRLLIGNFSNGAADHALGRKLYLRVREHIALDGRLGIVEEGGEHDLALRGRLKLHEVQPLRFNDLGVPVKKRMRITVAIDLDDTGGKKAIFHDHELQAFEEFSDTVPPVTTESAVRDIVIDQLARRIARKVISGWYTDLMTPAEKGKR
ncbi:MAG TPA: hypothetical protein ENN21_08070 [Spirochaetes bacterium]|nr:hypothetical protein [Spirochaetota bacterium]